jgi:ABC-type nickel/cobalt efflux system permease component RcnA
VSAIHTTLPVLTPAAGETTVQTGSSKTDAGHGDHHTHHHHHHAQDHGADHAHAHDAACGCGHSHAPDPRQLQGAFDWRRGIAVVLAAGLRPCSGAIIVLVFALSQGLLWAGVASAYAMALGTGITVAALAALAVSGSALAVQLAGRGSPWAGRVQRTVEIGGSLAVLALGIILVGGALSGDGSL